MAKKYIPNNAWLTCDKGQSPTQISVTHDNNSSIYGEKLVSEADMMPGENIKPFGTCAITGGPCSFMPIYWNKCNEGVKVNGFKLVFEDAHLLCQQTGKIEVEFNAPSGDVFIGTGIGTLNALSDFNKMAPNLKGVDKILPIDELRWSQTTARNTFGDGRAIENSRNSILRSGNAYGQIEPLEVVRMDDGKFTSLDHRRGMASVDAGAKEVPVRIYEGNTVLTPEQSSRFKVETSKQAKRLGLNIDDVAKTYQEAVEFRSAKQSPKIPLLGTENVPSFRPEPLKPPSKASQLIGKVSQSISDTKFSQNIRNSQRVLDANEYLAKNATKIAKVGKVVGRGAIVVGIVIDAVSIGSAYQEEGEFGDKTQQATGSAIGGAAGAWAGAEIGALIGTAICPGVGTVIGGVIGGIAGGIIGSGAGAKIVDWLF